MEIADILEYTKSSHFYSTDEENTFHIPDYGHIFRKAHDFCGLKGVYTLQTDLSKSNPIVPVVYVCKANNEQEAGEIHKHVWLQNVGPFVITVIVSLKTVRLYSGFNYSDNSAKPDKNSGILQKTIEFNRIADLLVDFKAISIDNGTIWGNWGHTIYPEKRVDVKILKHLAELDKRLRNDFNLPKESAHALIGRYVYLRYLKDRNILSERKLTRWNINEDDVFSRDACLNSFWQLVDNVDEWLNGALFPLSAEQRKLINLNHLRLVTGTFAGDEPSTGQLHLDFQAYDFSFIPIETLSNIYEQFLHTTDHKTESKGKKTGTYYTPIPLVNFMLEEIDAKFPLSNGMKILDPTCGSGAFLVQVYRRIIEKELIAGKKCLTPVELRDLLTKHIFGVDKDPDACCITELSLQLTLLDYLNPPDLENNPRFKLPDLRNKNIYETDFLI